MALSEHCQIFFNCCQTWQETLGTDRLEQIFLPPPCCALVRQPGSDHKMSAAAQKTPCFADQPGLERNVLGAFNGDYGIEAFCRQVVLQRIDQYKIELLIAVRRGFGMVELFRRDRKS